MTLAALYVIVPVWSIIGRSFKSLIFTLSTDENFYVLVETYTMAGWLDVGTISSSLSIL